MEKIKDIFNQYLAQLLDWYDGLSQVYQYGVIFLLIVIGFFIVAFFIISRITK